MLNLKKVLSVAALSTAIAMPAQAGFVLDSFIYTSPVSMSVAAGSGATDSDSGGYVISGQAPVDVNVTASYTLTDVTTGPTLPNQNTDNSSFNQAGGVLSFTEAGVNTNAELDINWSGTFDAAFGPFAAGDIAPLDFTLGGDPGASLYIDIIALTAGIGGFVIDMTFVDAFSVTSVGQMFIGVADAGTTVMFALSNLVGGADLSKVVSVNAKITSPRGDTSFVLGEIGVVPEPATIALLGLGIFGLGLRGRKKSA